MAAPAAFSATLPACRFQSQREPDSFAFFRRSSSPTASRSRHAASLLDATACIGSAPSRAVGRSKRSRVVPISAFTAPTVASARLLSVSSVPARTLWTTMPTAYAPVQPRHHQVAYGRRCSRCSSMKRRRSAVPASQRDRSAASAAAATVGRAAAKTSARIRLGMCVVIMLARPPWGEQESSRCR